ncbi:hypothetical protein Lal_00033684 [Lupinus albus]|nr:hypothetical protein Lal_00033684 [Lupinus albus]
MNENLQNLNQNANPHPNQHPLAPQGPAENHGVDAFCRRNLSQFEGGFAPDAANEWIQDLEKILRAMGCGDNQKINYASYMLTKEAENWWEYTRRQIARQLSLRRESSSIAQDFTLPGDHFSLRRESLAQNDAKFEELAKYYPYYELDADGRSKCAKFEVGLKPELKMMFGHQEITDFPTLVNKCRMYEDYRKVRDTFVHKVNPPRNFGPQRNFISQGSKPPTFPRGQQLNSPPVCTKCGRNHFGPVLVAINPFKKVPLYGNDYIEAYKRKTIESSHVYAITRHNHARNDAGFLRWKNMTREKKGLEEIQGLAVSALFHSHGGGSANTVSQWRRQG